MLSLGFRRLRLESTRRYLVITTRGREGTHRGRPCSFGSFQKSGWRSKKAHSVETTPFFLSSARWSWKAGRGGPGPAKLLCGVGAGAGGRGCSSSPWPGRFCIPILRATGPPGAAAAAAAADARGRPGRSQGRGLAHRHRATAEAGAAIFHPGTARAAGREPYPRVGLRPRHSPAASLDSGPVRLESPNTVRLKLPRR